MAIVSLSTTTAVRARSVTLFPCVQAASPVPTVPFAELAPPDDEEGGAASPPVQPPLAVQGETPQTQGDTGEPGQHQEPQQQEPQQETGQQDQSEDQELLIDVDASDS